MNIVDTSNRFQIIWDLGRRCSYSCSYCPPHRNNKWSPFIDYKTLCSTMDKVSEYVDLYDSFRLQPIKKKLSFTGGEPTIHPDFFNFMEYIKNNYPDYSRGLTTNGWFTRKTLDLVKQFTTTGTISYHCESLPRMKKIVIDNAIELKDTYKVNVMFHKDYFDECVRVCEKLDQHSVNYIPRIIGDDEDDTKAIELGYAHKYNKQQMKWFRDYWNQKGSKTNTIGNSQKGLGRPCCGGRCFKVDGQDTYFLANTNFKGWSCMINWFFLFLNSELDTVYTHQTCGVNLDGNVAPLGKISEFDNIIDNLQHKMFIEKRMPIITCPKSFCGCGMCITKSSTFDQIVNDFNNHCKILTPYPLPKQSSNNLTDITVRSLFNTTND